MLAKEGTHAAVASVYLIKTTEKNLLANAEFGIMENTVVSIKHF